MAAVRKFSSAFGFNGGKEGSSSRGGGKWCDLPGWQCPRGGKMNVLKIICAQKIFIFIAEYKDVNGIIVLLDDGARGAKTCSRNTINVLKE